jgi:hypothetical protein
VLRLEEVFHILPVSLVFYSSDLLLYEKLRDRLVNIPIDQPLQL